jgi:hypothetical protein
MSVELPREGVPRSRSRSGELRALRAAQARNSRLEISVLELRERARALAGGVGKSRTYTERRVVSDDGLRALLAASDRLGRIERDLLLTRQALRRVQDEVRIRTRRWIEWGTTSD